jgi:hypothetical protein
VLAFWIIEHLNIIENILSGFITRFIDLAADTLSFEQIEEAFDDSVIVTVPSAAHRMFKIVSLQESRPVHASKL